MILTYVGDIDMYEIKFLRTISEHVLEINPADGVVIPVKNTGFCVQEPPTPACNFAKYKTLYRQIDNKLQYSDNGEEWVEPVSDVVVKIIWNDNDNVEGIRPNAVKVDVLVNGEKLETVTLNAKNNWSKEYIDIPESQIYTISAKDITGYEKNEAGATIYFTDSNLIEVEEVSEVTMSSKDEQIENLTNTVNELLERIKSLENKEA